MHYLYSNTAWEDRIWASLQVPRIRLILFPSNYSSTPVIAFILRCLWTQAWYSGGTLHYLGPWSEGSAEIKREH